MFFFNQACAPLPKAANTLHILSNVKYPNQSDEIKLDINKINPWFITGFSDAEGSFLISIRPNSKLKIGYSVELAFKIGLHSNDKNLLEDIKSYFQVGAVRKQGEDGFEFQVSSFRDLQVIVNHFNNYPLISQKWSDFKLFTQVIELMEKKEHLTQKGLEKIVSIKSVFNKGLPDNLKSLFPNVYPELRPSVPSCQIPDPNWLSGFVSGDGNFLIIIKKYLNNRTTGFQFLVTQHIRDTELLTNFVAYLGCGYYSVRASNPMAGDYHVAKFQDLKDKIIPFFDKYPIRGEKFLDYSDFKEALLSKKPGQNLTRKELDRIVELKSRMNNGRRPSSTGIKLSTPFTTPGGKREFSTSVNLAANSINNSWLAGLIDGGGQFQTTKKGISSFKIVMHLNDKSLLYLLKHYINK